MFAQHAPTRQSLGVVHRIVSRLFGRSGGPPHATPLRSTACGGVSAYDEGYARYRAGDHAAAAELFRRVLHDAPDDTDALRYFGAALGEQGYVELAVVPLRRLATLRPNDPFAHFELGQALARCGRYAEAVLALRLAASLKPDLHGVTEALRDAVRGRENLPLGPAERNLRIAS